ncbi:MAG: radical SAM protein [Planctomycetota bacterium]|nr:radical SAM protein [Planctomycetota bacterium]MDA0921501.1 radical SAM protein [Planctomycetota bacterium]MDA1160040.1 radical SAM protein [Planctomycetota bacterium]
MKLPPSDNSDRDILDARSARNSLDVDRPYEFLVEPERGADGQVEDVATIFLTNRECPFTCLMCDLWKNTTVEPVPVGAIPRQINYALQRLPKAQHVKLYNSGNFFDAKAIPKADWPAIVDRVRGFKSVIVENHPKLCGEGCFQFRDMLAAQNVELEIALGLETVHPEVLPRLNKQMTVDDFSQAAKWLRREGIRLRTFILLRPPFLTEEEGIEWAMRSIEFAFDQDVSCCSVVPTRAGNGIMEQLEVDDLFASPQLASMEIVQERGIQLGAGRVFMDTWDAQKFASCSACSEPRIQRITDMNLSQQVVPRISCDECGKT